VTKEIKSLPAPNPNASLSLYLNQIRQFPLLTKDEEYTYGKRWREDDDVQSAHILVTSHLRLAARVAHDYRGYGLPLADLIAEANLGLMHAVRRFEPERGFRLATYALWWIRAQVQEFVLKSWSLVKLGTTGSQKKLFFNLRKAKELIGVIDSGELRPDDVKKLSKMMNVPAKEVRLMNGRLSGQDSSLNATVGQEGDSKLAFQDLLVDESADHEAEYAEEDEKRFRRELLNQALEILDAREKDILIKRKLTEPNCTLETLSKVYKVSRERIRQIEVRAFEKVSRRVVQLESEQRRATRH